MNHIVHSFVQSIEARQYPKVSILVGVIIGVGNKLYPGRLYKSFEISSSQVSDKAMTEKDKFKGERYSCKSPQWFLWLHMFQ